uniref:Mos1 transposase HTH domain-containing protein n=1 Tax=Lepeophtheirus salmonis TaxID=72036 RepID=A0A0K2URE2_LEPSM
MEVSNKEICHILFFHCLKGKNTLKAIKNFCIIYRIDTLSFRIAQ